MCKSYVPIVQSRITSYLSLCCSLQASENSRTKLHVRSQRLNDSYEMSEASELAHQKPGITPTASAEASRYMKSCCL